MLPKLLTSIFGSRNERLLKQYRRTVDKINALEPTLESLTDEQLRAKTEEFKQRVAKGESLDDLLPEAFAVVREGSKRVFKMRHFDVQMLGGMALHFGKIAEMRTGEGKTLTGTLPVYLNALVLSTEPGPLADRARALLSDLHARLALVISQLKADGVIAEWVDPEAMASLLIATGNGIALQTQLDPEGATAAQLAAQLAGLLLAASTQPGTGR